MLKIKVKTRSLEEDNLESTEVGDFVKCLPVTDDDSPGGGHQEGLVFKVTAITIPFATNTAKDKVFWGGVNGNGVFGVHLAKLSSKEDS